MPELPEVEACRRLAEKHCTGKRIQEAQVAEDNKVIEGIEATALQQTLVGRTIKEAHRKGKHMWLELDKEPCLMLHFGMTGSLVVKGVKSHQYKNFKVDEAEWPPKYWKLALKLEGGVSIAFSDPRRFARIRLQEEPAEHEPVSLLGFDPVLSMPPLEESGAAVKARKTSLKALLLDQAFSAGVGNWVADEVLYQAKLYPEVKASTLSDEEIKQLHAALKYVPETAVEAEAESERFPQDWLFHVRWNGPKKAPKLNGNAVEFLKVGGRTTAYVPAIQKAPAQDGSTSKKASGKRKAKAEDEDSDEDQEDEQSTEEADEQPKAKAKPRRATAAKPVRKRKKPPAAEESVSDAAEESEDGGQQDNGKTAARRSQGSKTAAKSVSYGEKEGKKQPKRGAKAASRAKPAVNKASDSEEEEDQRPKRAAKVAKGNKSAGKKGTNDAKDKQQQPKKAVKNAAKSRAATSRGKTKAAATDAADSASEDTNS